MANEKYYYPDLKDFEKDYLRKRQLEFEKIPNVALDRLSHHANLPPFEVHFFILLNDLHLAKNKYNEFSAKLDE